MAGHAAGHGMDDILHVAAVRLKEVAEFPHRVLGLRDRHAVARDDDDTSARPRG